MAIHSKELWPEIPGINYAAYLRQKRVRPCITRMMQNEIKINENSHQIHITA